MGCVSYPVKHSTADKISEQQVALLRKIHDDVASRSLTNNITKQNFCLLFHLRGLWGQLIFNKFKSERQENLSFQGLVRGIEQLDRGKPGAKIHALFEYFAIDHKDGISYVDLLKMLYSYPTEELREVTMDEEFMRDMTPYEKDIYFNGLNLQQKPYLLEFVNKPKRRQPTRAFPPKKLYSEQIKIQIQPGRSTQYEVPILQHHGASVPNPNSRPAEKLQTIPQSSTYQGQSGKSSKDNSTAYTNSHPSTKQNSKTSETNVFVDMPAPNQEHTNLRKPVSIGARIRNLNDVRIVSKVTLLVNKYAKFIFGRFNLDPQTDFLNQRQFSKIVGDHYKIFATYFTGFLQYIWTIHDGLPAYMQETPQMESQCVVLEEKTGMKKNAYLRLHHNVLVVMKNQTSKALPDEIKCLDGLIVNEYSSGGNFGFEIRHRDGIYPEKIFLSHDKSIAQKWNDHLATFRHVSVPQRYDFREKIGSGGFSRVYKAFHKDTKELVAIKIIEKFNFTPAQRHIIELEADIHKSCDHVNICRFVQKSQSKSHLYIVTEYLADGDLEEYVYAHTFLQEVEASNITRQILYALEHMHYKGLIHRDLKPENIMVQKCKDDRTKIEKIKIIDMGLSAYKDVLHTIPQKERYVGTPNYTPPEIYLGQDYDGKVDSFSLGVIIYYMLSGTLPFDSDFPEEVVSQTIQCDPHMDTHHWKNISDLAKDLVSKLICQKDKRITINEALEHKWIKYPQQLVSYIGTNNRRRYI